MLSAVSKANDRFVDITVPAWAWPALLALLCSLLLADLLIFNRRAHIPTFREAILQTSLWIGLGLSMTFVIGAMFNRPAAMEYISGYLIEESLSIDNVFVWAMIFAHFKVPREFQHRTLFWGIFGALVMRFIFIFLGVVIIERFEFVLIGFGAFLIYTGVSVLRSGGMEHSDPSDTRIMRLFRRFVPSTDQLDGQRMFTKVGGHRVATPLLAVLVVIEVSDLIFAVDSVPAVLAVSRERFIIFASNAFAIFGLRALYFLVSDLRERFQFLKHAISVLLAFVGAKMMISLWYHMPTPVSLIVIMIVITVAIVASIIHDRKH
ncbi:MAG: TerC/Alx family metal homeostasis membrane protein [Ilumatobacteraceae bacterium]